MSAIVNARFFVPDSSDFTPAVSWTGADFTGADMVLTVSSDWGAGAQTLLTASTDNGRIRIADDGAGFSYFIPQGAIQAVPAGLQRLQQVSTQKGVSQTLFRGTWSTAVGAPPASSGPIVFDGFQAPIEFNDPSATVQLNNTGEAGASAYQLWLVNGGRGTVQDFLASLQGAPGPATAEGLTATGADGSTQALQAVIDALQAQLTALQPDIDFSIVPQTYWSALFQELGVTSASDVDYSDDLLVELAPAIPLPLLLELL